MENHPIPQDITGFQFRLIGDMTVKQFGYVAGGVALGWIAFISPLFQIIKIPLAIGFVGLGLALAFIPIEGRPMDVMIANFFKAIFNPTQYIYQKTGGTLSGDGAKGSESLSEASERQLKDFLNAIPKGGNKLDKKETVFFQSLNQYANQPHVAQSSPGFVPAHAMANQTPPLSQQTPPPNTDGRKPLAGDEDLDLQKTAAVLQKELMEAKAKEAQPQVNSEEYLAAHQKVLELQKSMNDLSLQKQQLEQKLIDLQRKVQSDKTPVFSASLAEAEAPKETKFVRSIPQNMAKSVGLPTTPEFPNIITGIVKDARGNPIPNVLVEVKDGQENAVRAFKTNALGQFASATPLTNGDFTIEFEDQNNQHKFDKVGFKATGEIILPIEIISVDTREELRRTLFN